MYTYNVFNNFYMVKITQKNGNLFINIKTNFQYFI